MTNIYAPTGKHLKPIEVLNENGERIVLPEAIRGKSTLLFMATKSKHIDLFESVYSIWRSTFGVEHKTHIACYVSLLRNKPNLNMTTIEAAREAVREIAEGTDEEMESDTSTTTTTTSSTSTIGGGKVKRFVGNVMNTICLTSLTEMSKYILSMDIPNNIC
eukprot:gnl/Chilomastix_caulleri/1917.p1 GENE.gnl/Chilomastix_caulleri/1917~~gnl/Chilomastix_caulleri/1917.p1  ORF type:complete len:161 (+),score=37.33 gnl/Chilomastix_caulleri/1917:288-770(+)